MQKLNLLSHFTYGVFYSAFGPLIPYLSAATGLPEYDFNTIFALRGVAYIIAAIAHKTFLAKYSLQKKMIVSLAFGGIFFVLFYFTTSNLMLLSAMSFLLNCFLGSMNLLVKVMMTSLGKKDIKYFVNLSYAVYGIGSMLGSVFVAMFGLHTLIIIGIWMIGLGFIYIAVKNQSPEEVKPSQKQKNLLEKQVKTTKTIANTTLEYYFYSLFFLFSSISLTYRSWEPSFVVMERIASKQTAALAISLYSIFLTFFRFIFLFIKARTDLVLKIVSFTLLAILIFSTFSIHEYDWFLVYGTPSLLGMLFSSYVPYLYALPSQFQKSLSENSTMNTVIALSLGQVLIVAAVGYSMQITPYMLFYSLILMCTINIPVLLFTVGHLSEIDLKEETMKELNQNNSKQH